MMYFGRMLFAGLLLATSGAVTTVQAGGLAERIEIHDNIVDGYSAAGVRVWQHQATAPIQVEAKSRGVWEINGRELLGRDGRVLSRLREGASVGEQVAFDGTSLATAAETWSPAALIREDSYFFMNPVFDKSGNAWIAVADGASAGTQLMVSTGLTNIWTPVGNTLDVSFWTGSLTVDDQGDVTMACYCATDATANNQVIQVVRYEPATGLSAVQMIYNAPFTADYNEDNLYVTSDAAGDAIVAADIAAYGAASFYYSNMTKTWSGPTQIPMPLTINPYIPSVSMPSLARSPNGNYIQYTYDAAVNEGNFPSLGLFTNAYNTTTHTFGKPVKVPRSNLVQFSPNYQYFVPSFIDNTGATTVIWGTDSPKNLTYASRHSKSRWKTTTLYDGFLNFFGIFNGFDMDASGNILATVGVNVYDNSAGTVGQQVFKYYNGVWSNSTAVIWEGTNGTRTRISWLGTSGKAVMTYLQNSGNTDGYNVLSSTIWNGSAWTTPVAVPPGNVFAFLLAEAKDASGNVLLVYDPTCDATGSGGICDVTDTYATFMAP